MFSLRVPAVVVDGDAADARFHHAAGQQAGLPEVVAPVRIAQFVRLLFEIERFFGDGRGDQTVGPLIELVLRLRGFAGGLFVALPVVELAAQQSPPVHADQVVVRRGDILHAESRVVGIAVDDERVVGRAHVAAAAVIVGHPAEHGIGRHAVLEAFFPADDRAVAGVLVGGREGIAGQQIVRGRLVGAVRRGDGAQNAELVHLLGELGQLVADPDAFDVGSTTPNVPRISWGASGLGSKVSMWLGPPPIQSRMQAVSGFCFSASGFWRGSRLRLQQTGQGQAKGR